MKVIIKIDEEQYEFIKQSMTMYEVKNYHALLYDICERIKNGTPLPKGHGRLIDADALKKDDEVTIWRTRDSLRTGKTLKFFSELFVRKIEDAPTIIEAESEEQE